MDISNFSNSNTPVIECTLTGRVLGMNPAARAGLRGVRIGCRLTVRGKLCSLPFGTCLAAEREGRIYLMFCDFLRFDTDGAVYPTVAEALRMDAQALLDVISTFSDSKHRPQATPSLHRVRQLLYDRFAFVMRGNGSADGYSTCSSFFENYRTAAQKGFARVGGRLSFQAHALTDDYINVRNATVLITSICTLILSHTAGGTVSVHAAGAGEHLCLDISATPVLPMPVYACGGLLTELLHIFPAGAADLYSAQLCLDACDGRAEYAIEHGRLSIRLFLQCTKDLYTLLDPIAVKSIIPKIEKYIEHFISR